MTFLSITVAAAVAGSLCNDGWVSPSEGSGTCSHHGGVYDYPSPVALSTDYEGRREAQLIAEAFCRYVSDPNWARGCMSGLYVPESTGAGCEKQGPAAIACFDAVRVQINAEREWLETHLPEPPPDQIQLAREIYAQRFGTPADVERLRMKKAYDKLMAIPDDRKWMLLPTMKLDVAVKEIGRSQGWSGLTTRDNLPVALKFVVDGTCVTYSESLRLLVMKTDEGNILTISSYDTRKLRSTEEGFNEYAAAVAEAKHLGSISGEFCFSASTRYPWNK